MFKDLTVVELLGSIRDSGHIVDFYRTGLEEQNAMIAVCAQQELLRRGDSDLVVNTIKENIDKLEPDTTFTHLMCKSFLEAVPYEPTLRMLSRYVRAEAKLNKRTPTLKGFEAFINEREKSEEFVQMKSAVSDIIARYSLSNDEVQRMVSSSLLDVNPEIFCLRKRTQ